MPGVFIPTEGDYAKIALETSLGDKPVSFDANKLKSQMKDVKGVFKRADIEHKANRTRAGRHRKIVGKPMPEFGFSNSPQGVGSDVADGNQADATFNDLMFQSLFNQGTLNRAEATTVSDVSPSTTVFDKAGGESNNMIVGGHACVAVSASRNELAPILAISTDEITLAASVSAAPADSSKLGAVNSVLYNGTRLKHSQTLYVEMIGLDDADSGEIGGWVPQLEIPASPDTEAPQFNWGGPGVTMAAPPQTPDRTDEPGEYLPDINAVGRLTVALYDGTAQTATELEYWSLEAKIGGEVIKKGAAHDFNANAADILRADENTLAIYVPMDDDPPGSEATWRAKFLAGRSNELLLITWQQGDQRGYMEAITWWGWHIAADPEKTELDGGLVYKIVLEPNYSSGAPCIISRSAA